MHYCLRSNSSLDNYLIKFWALILQCFTIIDTYLRSLWECMILSWNYLSYSYSCTWRALIFQIILWIRNTGKSQPRKVKYLNIWNLESHVFGLWEPLPSSTHRKYLLCSTVTAVAKLAFLINLLLAKER